MGQGAALARATFEDYRSPVGRLENGVLRTTLDARPATWHPWGDDGPAVIAHVFAADGAPPRVPGPLIRVTVGTPVQVALRNGFESTLIVRGLRRSERVHTSVAGPPIPDSVVIAPGAAEEVRFIPAVAGTYVYSGHVSPARSKVARPALGMDEGNRSFIGVLIVDPPGPPPPPERIFLITHWADREIASSYLPATRFFINGASWPRTERLQYTEGDSVRWRVLNMTGRPHPMHLHGFFFAVDARGDLLRGTETVFPPAMRRLAVTEALRPGQSMRISWKPEEPGNWIFHCHFMRHMSRFQAAPSADSLASHRHGVGPDADLMMGGLVLGITVRPDSGAAPVANVMRRRIPLFIGKRPGAFGQEPGYGFVVQEGMAAPAADSVRFPGSTIVLTRDEPTEIVVRNRADVPLGVHWHGLELESWADGVPGWSGDMSAMRPAIAPGDSFVVRMTPPRAGTFMYHVHSEPGHQLALGLYGALLVMNPGERWDQETDRLFLLGSLGAGMNPPAAVNGEVNPGPIALKAGTTYRLRFMHISPDDDKRISLLAGDTAVTWRRVAKDGADLPQAQARHVPAAFPIHVGETHDFAWTPATPGEYTLRIVTTFDRGVPAFPREAPPPHTENILIRVLSSSAVGAQTPAVWTPPPTPRAIREIREVDLKRDLFAMASPAMRGREGGTIDELKASMWVAEQYRRIGLEPAGDDGSWFQWFNIVRTRVSVPASRAVIGGKPLTLFKDVVPLGVVPVFASARVLWLDDPADTTIDIRGRVVATTLRSPAPGSVRPFSYPYWNRYATAAINATTARLTRRGATTILLVADSVVDANFEGLGVMRGRGSSDVDNAPRTPTSSPRVAPVPAGGTGTTPALMVRSAMAPVLRGDAMVLLDIRLERFEVPSVNVIGRVRGTDPVLRDEHVLFSSHQDANGVRLLVPNDSILAGADDNASTTVAELAIARAFMAEKPKRSALFVNHGAEERGLLGSRYHAWHPVVPVEKIVAVLNGDMIGRNHPDTAGLLGSQPPHRNSMDLVRMALAANAAAGKFVIDSSWDRPDHPEGFYFRSDHAPYARRGIPAVYWTAMLHEDYHTANDVPERIDYGKLTRMAQWMYLTGWYAASAARRPSIDAGFQLER